MALRILKSICNLVERDQMKTSPIPKYPVLFATVTLSKVQSKVSSGSGRAHLEWVLILHLSWPKEMTCPLCPHLHFVTSKV